MIDEAIILLGGIGTRMLPLTKTIPKEMLPIYDVPNIFLLVEEAYNSGIKNIIFVVTDYNRQIIENFFSDNKYLDDLLKNKPEKLKLLDRIKTIIKNVNFTFVYQDLKGTFGALYSAKDYIKGDNFIVMYGDDLIDTNPYLTKQLIDSFKINKQQQVAIFKEDISKLPNGGIAVIDDKHNLIDLKKKKDTDSRFIVHGRMLLNKKIFDVKDKLQLHEFDEYYLTYALLYFNDVYAYDYQGDYFNIGEKTGYIKASIHYALKDQNEEIKKYIRSLNE